MFYRSSFLSAECDWRLVALAAAVCFFASLVAINLFHRAEASTGAERWVWLSLDAVAAGYGIWATDFIAILAYQHTLGGGYDPTLTVVSLLIAIVVAWGGCFIPARNLSRWSSALGGAILVSGVAAMHFTGILALELPGLIVWSPSRLIVASLVGVVPGGLAFIVARRRRWWNTIAASILATISVLAMHFLAMNALDVVSDSTKVVEITALSAETLSVLLAGAAAMLLGMCLVAALSDLRSKDSLEQQKALLNSAIENMPQGVCMFDASGCISLFNERYVEMFGLSASALKGQSLLKILKGAQSTGFLLNPEELCARVLSNARAGESQSRIFEISNARTIHVLEHPMQGGGWIATFEDITKERETRALITHMARHDDLTNLPNRRLFREERDHALDHIRQLGKVAVLCIDLDRFKDVNDSFGHPVGDALLKAVSLRLSACLRKSDTVSRLGGDEFAIVQVGLEAQPSEAEFLAARLVKIVTAPYIIDGHNIIIGASVGITIAPDDGNDPDELLKNADLALYLAKADGRGAYRFFKPEMNTRTQARLTLIADLRAASLRDEFEVYYQPIYDLKTDRITCFEALVRWNHPQRGLISPGSFIPLAEETGLIIKIGDWVIRKACMDAAGWSRPVNVAVNLSSMQFKDDDLLRSVFEGLTAAGLSTNRLELEITESVLLQDTDLTLAVLHKFKEAGIGISLDDFGTGYSSLSYLRSFPFDKIKIDREFVSELASKGDLIAIVRAVVALGKSLGIKTLAEGVETREQLELLRAEGCDEVQSFLFSQPQPNKEVEKMLSLQQLRAVA